MIRERHTRVIISSTIVQVAAKPTNYTREEQTSSPAQQPRAVQWGLETDECNNMPRTASEWAGVELPSPLAA